MKLDAKTLHERAEGLRDTAAWLDALARRLEVPAGPEDYQGRPGALASVIAGR